jgi:endoglucanase
MQPSDTEHWTRARLAWGVTGLAILSSSCGPIGSAGSSGPAADAGGGGSADGGGGGAGKVPSDGGGAKGPGPDAAPGPVSGQGEAGSPPNGLHVEGNHFVDNGKTVRLLGVDHSGSEYTCVNTGTAIFEGPTDASLVTPMKAWKVNTVRVPLNEDCWLGINGVAAAVSGAAYQQAITAFVQMLRQNGMYVIVDLHWNAPGATLAKSQQPMPDADHAEDFWISVANAFKSDMGVVFDLYNEPYPDEGTSDPGGCLLDGCALSGWTGYSGSANAVGMQELVTDVRTKASAENVILIGGWAYASAIGSWLQYEPKDPLANLAASFHTYNDTGCNDALCWTNTVAPVAAKVPVVTGELGENDCAESYVDSYFAWADPLGISYLGWSWNVQTCGSFPALITSYAGTPTAFGQGFLTHLPTQ